MEVSALRSGDPDRLGAYTLVGRVGEGGQGTVFLAEDGSGRQVALKLLHGELTDDDKARARFLRELEVAKQVASFCTAPVIDAEVDGDRPFIVSEYVAGPSLNDMVGERGPLEGPALERLAVGTATALSAIHQAQIVHRDFKPHNVLMGPDGPRVIDFGVARALSGTTTLTSKVIGTPSYMAPEHLQGEEIGTAADVFCWASTLVYAATGEPPFGQDTIPAVINRILHEEPDLGDDYGPLTGTLRDLVLDCLEKEPADRPQAQQVLMRLLGHASPAPARGPDEILAAGVLAAERDDPAGSSGPGRTSLDATAMGAGGFDDDWPAGSTGPGGATRLGTGPLPTPAEWAADDTLPPGKGPHGRRPAALSGQRGWAAMAGAAALVVAVTLVSTFMLLGGDGGTRGRQVGETDQPVPASSTAPSTSSTPTPTVVPQQQDTARPTLSPSPSPGPTTTKPSPSDTPTMKPTKSPSPSPSDEPSDTPTPSETPTKTPKPPDE